MAHIATPSKTRGVATTVVVIAILVIAIRHGYDMYEKASPPPPPPLAHAPQVEKRVVAQADPEVWVRIAPPRGSISDLVIVEENDGRSGCFHSLRYATAHYVTYDYKGNIRRKGSDVIGPGKRPNFGKLEGRTEFSFESQDFQPVEVRGRKNCF